MTNSISADKNSTDPDLSVQNPADAVIGSADTAILSAADDGVVQSNLPSITRGGPFNHPEADELYWTCRKSGDSHREAKAEVRRAGY